jgi:hypothetical protein
MLQSHWIPACAGMTECEAGLEKINTILTPALSLKEREKCGALRKPEHFKVTGFPPARE